jgi:hypothetical protein
MAQNDAEKSRVLQILRYDLFAILANPAPAALSIFITYTYFKGC